MTRAFPIGSLVKEKHVSGRFRVGPDQWLSDCIQLRSCVFQVGFQVISMQFSCY